MVSARTAHNRTVYASPPVGGSGYGTLCEMAEAGKETHWARDKNLRDVLIHLLENLSRHERRILEKTSGYAVGGRKGNVEGKPC
jgi:hypothetical protein